MQTISRLVNHNNEFWVVTKFEVPHAHNHNHLITGQMIFTECPLTHLIPPTKIRFGINVPYFGAANCASSCPFEEFVTAIVCICNVVFTSVRLRVFVEFYSGFSICCCCCLCCCCCCVFFCNISPRFVVV